MTELVWDQISKRRFETGIDRGVLFLLDGTTVPWNGLTSITEVVTREVKSYYLDGVKYLDRHVPGSYSAKLQAFTYPEELPELIGTSEFSPGVSIHDQRAVPFHLSYRTLIGNDVDGVDHGYKIHILYNVLASPGDMGLDTLQKSIAPKAFEWTLTGTPSTMFGIRPTSHISFSSISSPSELLTFIEEMLYGTFEADPDLLGLVDLLGLIEEEAWPGGPGGGGGGGPAE